MSNEINDGGPAFPRPHTIADANDESFKLGHPGMTLRDYFAARFFAARISAGLRTHLDMISRGHKPLTEAQREELRNNTVRAAWADADAMLAARKESRNAS